MSVNNRLLDHLFRTEYGKLIATVTRFFGPAHLQQAEDIVQETLITALNHWSVDDIPDNPTGWLIQVAKRKALNELSRRKMIQHHQSSGMIPTGSAIEIDDFFLENEIADNQLRMIFTCCHPLLNTESQIALVLKTLCGFGVKELAHALLTSESTINKRLYRAKKYIRDKRESFTIPQGSELTDRLEAVCLTLYLLFNEGYNSAVSDALIRKELCLEAIRLGTIVHEHFPDIKKVSALLALMCFHSARFDARIDDHGAIILFEDQDRNLWNKQLINIGMLHFHESLQDSLLSTYHLEAGIAAEHCLATDFETTNWQSIYQQYRQLERIKPNPVIALNLAIIQSKIEGLEASIKSLALLANKQVLLNYHLLPATQGIFYMKLGEFAQARSFLRKALELSPSSAESKLLQNKLAECMVELAAPDKAKN